MTKILNRSISIFIMIIMLLTPFQLIGQRSRIEDTEDASVSQSQARIDAEADAERDVSKITWLGCGCILTYIAVGAAYLAVPGPKPERLMGKPPDYVWTYTQAYKAKRRSIQTRYAMVGCATSTILVMTACLIALQQENVECCINQDYQCGPDITCGSVQEPSCSESEGSGCESPSCSE